MREITFKQIQKANESIKTTDIKGKEYAEVNQRIKAFRMVFPDGFIKTELVKDEDGKCTFRAYVGYVRDDGIELIISTGTAYEKEGSTFINKTSYIENCETSAVGRALGLAGFGIDVSVASAEEVQNAQLNQELSKPLKEDKYKKTIMKELEKAGKKSSELEALAGMKEWSDLTMERYIAAMKELGAE